MKRLLGLVLPVFCMALALSGYASASAVTYSGSSGGLSASAIFNYTGSTLTVTLTNTSTGDAKDATGILLAVLFDTSTTLTPTSASIGGSTVYGSFVHDVGEGWQYKSGISMHGENSGISGAGYGVFGPDGNFYSTGQKLDGSDYGIAPIGYTNTGNPSIKDPIIQNSITFTLDAPGFNLNELGKTIVFQYGTSTSEPNFTGNLTSTPEPSTMCLVGGGLLTAFMNLRKKRSKVS